MKTITTLILLFLLIGCTEEELSCPKCTGKKAKQSRIIPDADGRQTRPDHKSGDKEK